jgi:hypothetical protein
MAGQGLPERLEPSFGGLSAGLAGWLVAVGDTTPVAGGAGSASLAYLTKTGRHHQKTNKYIK